MVNTITSTCMNYRFDARMFVHIEIMHALSALAPNRAFFERPICDEINAHTMPCIVLCSNLRTLLASHTVVRVQLNMEPSGVLGMAQDLAKGSGAHLLGVQGRNMLFGKGETLLSSTKTDALPWLE